ncbi:MAG: hypothetical protein KatS3mg114_0961 [Planctomycetaceae bacterium]|jgi:outer membrane protein, heavy metal efflux system|nr:MAG: hypothetical protein KatS3mg114_0961 [Planctomycetaceae bacterium]
MARRRMISWPLLAAILLVGCKGAQKVHDPEYAQVSRSVHQAGYSPVPTATAVSPVNYEFTGPQPVEVFLQYALSQNAGVQVARKRIDAAAMRVPQAASLKDPMLDVTGYPFYPNVPQTASGRMTVDMMVSQEVPWFGKLDTQAAAVEAEVNAARAQLAAAELKTIEEVKRAYYELYYFQKAIRVVQQDRKILADLIEVANALYVTGKTSQQDVLRLQAELSNVDGELIRMEQMRVAAQADLARLMHISPETPLEAVAEISDAAAPYDLAALYQQAIRDRPELHAMLAEINRDQRMVERARLEYYPDVTFKFGWGEMTTSRAVAPSADGIDNLAVGLGVNLPIYRGRLKAAVREAEATAVASAREYDQMKDETQRDVKQLFTQALSQRDTDALFRESIIPKTQQALDVAVRGYQVGETEFADLIANWRELLRFHVTQLQLEAQYRQTLASLERVVGGLPTAPPSEIPPPPEEPRPLPAPQ